MRSTLVLKFILTLVIATLVGGVFFTSVTAKTTTDNVSCGSDTFCSASLILGEQCPESDPLALINHHGQSAQKQTEIVFSGIKLSEKNIDFNTTRLPAWLILKFPYCTALQQTVAIDWSQHFLKRPPDWKISIWLAKKKHSPTIK